MMDNFYKIQDRRIKREEISTLLFSMDNDISTHSLSMWIKSKTDDEWVVVPKKSVLRGFGMLNSKYLKQIEEYL
jgi:hypothetical protein